MTHETDSFVQEVDESLRQDQLQKLAKRFGPYFIAAAAALIIGVGGWQGWRAYSASAARAQSDRLAAAQQLARDGNLDGAKEAFAALTTSGPSQYRLIAMLERGAVLEAQGDLDGALAQFDEAAGRARDPIMRETAQLRAAYIAAETQDLAAMQERLRPLLESDSRISFLARELLAIQAWKAGDADLARDTLQNLSLALDAPEGVRQRAQVALTVLGPAPQTAQEGASQTPASSEGESQ